ncbi:LysM peptidoglycan-binding domain-containing protein [Salmonirosea aquatica]|uniref:LysM peptidoglycan-binding domain-containing protein n=1 Tax=Salmonirosea aquatica TaxID=2654236 RepID=A0A7C9FBQ7_9BACT|nr:LysM peptidoglycan-binding domain-containing protein [Cytophagaceae bacterium SJW1-29]
MYRTNSIFLSLATVCFLLFAGADRSALAQDIPDIPNSVQFGGLVVKFDNGARKIIESDVRSLMANKRFWEDKMDRAVLYFPILEAVLIEEEVPIDFKYLAVQESSLTPDAVSSSNAVGFWQFKQETARELNLRVDNQVDERKNIAASTHAAARYLKRSNVQFNNWVSSLYSYYLGMGGITKLIPSNWANAREVTLNDRTDRYVLRFFAHKIALESGLERHRTANPIVLMEYSNARGRNFEAVAREFNLDPLELRRYNRWLESDQIPADREYALVLPVSLSEITNVREKLAIVRQDAGNGMDYASADIGFPVLRKASVQLKGRNDPVFYEINGLPGIRARPGDKASDLAKAAKISTAAFLKYNDLGSRDPLVPGDVYYLAMKNKKAMVPFHTARENETIRNISQIYGLRIRDLMKYNRISNRNMRLQKGRVMWLMKKRPAKTPIEIIDSKAPVNDNVVAQPELISSAPAPTIPQTPSERKKYTPKLADGAPLGSVQEEPAKSAPTQSTQMEPVPAKTPVPVVEDKPVATTPPVQSTPARASGGSNDRIVIISSQNDTSSPAFESETSTPTRNRTTTTPPPTKSTPSTTTNPSTNTKVPTRTPPAKGTPRYHSVEKGQTYYSISRQYNVKISDLLAWNQLTLKDQLEIGQQLVVSPSGGTSGTSSSSAVPAASSSATRAEYTVHTVTSGETLFRISQNYGVSIADIQRMNNMSGVSVILGEKLKIPKN